jgi:hypothetical protein
MLKGSGENEKEQICEEQGGSGCGCEWSGEIAKQSSNPVIPGSRHSPIVRSINALSLREVATLPNGVCSRSWILVLCNTAFSTPGAHCGNLCVVPLFLSAIGAGSELDESV